MVDRGVGVWQRNWGKLKKKRHYVFPLLQQHTTHSMLLALSKKCLNWNGNPHSTQEYSVICLKVSISSASPQAVHLQDPIRASFGHLNTSGLSTFLYRRFVQALPCLPEDRKIISIYGSFLYHDPVGGTLLKGPSISFCQCNQDLLKHTSMKSNFSVCRCHVIKPLV